MLSYSSCCQRNITAQQKHILPFRTLHCDGSKSILVGCWQDPCSYHCAFLVLPPAENRARADFLPVTGDTKLLCNSAWRPTAWVPSGKPFGNLREKKNCPRLSKVPARFIRVWSRSTQQKGREYVAISRFQTPFCSFILVACPFQTSFKLQVQTRC